MAFLRQTFNFRLFYLATLGLVSLVWISNRKLTLASTLARPMVQPPGN
jgi:hypothetical protein